MRDNTYKCDCCGAPINPATMKCEYCGTQYQHRGGNIVRIETFRNPVHTLAVENRISMFDVKALGVRGQQRQSWRIWLDKWQKPCLRLCV